MLTDMYNSVTKDTTQTLPEKNIYKQTLNNIWINNILTIGSNKILKHDWEICILKPTRCTNFSNLFLEWNATCFGQFLCPSSGVFHCTHSNGICHTVLQAAACKTVWHIPMLCVQWKTPDDGQRNCLKHVEFDSKNKFEKSVHLVGFNIQIYHDARSHEHHMTEKLSCACLKVPSSHTT